MTTSIRMRVARHRQRQVKYVGCAVTALALLSTILSGVANGAPVRGVSATVVLPATTTIGVSPGALAEPPFQVAATADGRARTVALLRFDTSAIPEDARVDSALMSVTVGSDDGPGVETHMITEEWDPETARSQPPRWANRREAVTDLLAGSRTTIDVTKAVRHAYRGQHVAPYGFALIPGGELPHTTPLVPIASPEMSERPTLSVVFEAEDIAAPTVSLTAPAESSLVFGTVAISAQATDDVAVEKVEFLVDGRVIATERPSPYESGYAVEWKTDEAVDGPHTITARATDFAGKVHQDSVVVRLDNDAASAERLEADLASGRISTDEFVEYVSYAAFTPELLPARYVSSAPRANTEALLARVTQLQDAMTDRGRRIVRDYIRRLDEGFYNVQEPVNRRDLRSAGIAASSEDFDQLCDVSDGWFSQPSMHCEYVTHDAKWRITFALEGFEDGISRVDENGQDGFDGPNGVPDHVDRVVDSLDDAWERYVVELGYQDPEPFHLEVQLGGTDGGIAPPPGSIWQGAASDGADIRISAIDDSYATAYLPRHEFFHIVQWEHAGISDYLGGIVDDDGFVLYLEASANWATDRTYDGEIEVDATHYLDIDDFLGTPSSPLGDHDLSSGREYGAFLLPTFLAEQYGDDAVRESWERMGDSDDTAFEAIAHAISQSDGSVLEFYRDFAVANYRLEPFNSDPDDGYVNQDVDEWVSVLGLDDRTDGDSTDDTGRPKRETAELANSQQISGESMIFPGGASYIDLTRDGDVSGRLTVDIASRAVSPDLVRGAVLGFGDYPQLCTDPVPINFDDPLDPFNDSVEVDLPDGCTFATLVLAHPSPGAYAEARVDWSAHWASNDEHVVIAGSGTDGDEVRGLSNVLASADYEVTISAAIPESLAGVDQLWWVDYRAFPEADVARLSAFVEQGGGLYLTGERPCCEALNSRVSAVANSLIAEGDIQVGGLGDPFYAHGAVAVNPDAVGGVTAEPFSVTEVMMNAPGGMAGLEDANVLARAPGNGIPVAGAWDSAELAAGNGRLVVVMDVNWLDPRYTGPQSDELMQNIAWFLSSQMAPPETAENGISPRRLEQLTVETAEPHPTTAGQR